MEYYTFKVAGSSVILHDMAAQLDWVTITPISTLIEHNQIVRITLVSNKVPSDDTKIV